MSRERLTADQDRLERIAKALERIADGIDTLTQWLNVFNDRGVKVRGSTWGG